MGPRNRVGTGLSLRPAGLHRQAGRYDKSVLTRFLAPIDCSKIPAQITYDGGIESVESILGVLKTLQKFVKKDRCWWKIAHIGFRFRIFVFVIWTYMINNICYFFHMFSPYRVGNGNDDITSDEHFENSKTSRDSYQAYKLLYFSKYLNSISWPCP